jgi:uncharacterized protein YpuA (DUF1002 family)
MKKILILAVLVFSLSLQPVFAAANPGDRVITLGGDLSPQQKQGILNEFAYTNKDKLIVVTQQDEAHYIQGSSNQGRELSSSLITFKDKGTGIKVTKTSNITQVSEQMYQNALVTGGIQDAEVYVTSPEPVTGTAALTGIFKAFETVTGKPLDENRKKVANEEVTDTSKLGQSIGNPKLAADFVQRLKEEIQKQNPKTDADYQQLIEAIAKEMGIQLTPDQVQGLVDLMKKINALNIDWGSVGTQLQNVAQKVGQYAKDNPDKVNAILDFFKQLFTSLQGLLQKLFT